MGFYRQLDLLVTTLTTLVVFIGCTLSGALSVKASLFIAAAVFLGGLLFGADSKGSRVFLNRPGVGPGKRRINRQVEIVRALNFPERASFGFIP